MAPDAVVIGGGLAGGVAAYHLATAGLQVVLLERSEGPHDKVCGEFLSGEALAELRAVGLEPLSLGAVPLTHVRTAARGGASPAALPFEALSLTRRVLDEALLARASEMGAEVRRGETVLTASPSRATLRGGETLTAPHLILATGKHDLRGHKRPPGRHDHMVGIKTYLELSPDAAADLKGCVDVVFFPGGYIGFQEVEGGRVNACLAAEPAALAELDGDPEALIFAAGHHSAHAARLLDGAVSCLPKPLAVGRVPYGLVRETTEFAYLVGDQAAVIPSFCGEGMGLALRSGRLAAEAVLSDVSPQHFQRSFARIAGPRVRAAAALSAFLARPRQQRLASGVAAAAPALVTALAAVTRTPARAS